MITTRQVQFASFLMQTQTYYTPVILALKYLVRIFVLASKSQKKLKSSSFAVFFLLIRHEYVVFCFKTSKSSVELAS